MIKKLFIGSSTALRFTCRFWRNFQHLFPTRPNPQVVDRFLKLVGTVPILQALHTYDIYCPLYQESGFSPHGEATMILQSVKAIVDIFDVPVGCVGNVPFVERGSDQMTICFDHAINALLGAPTMNVFYDIIGIHVRNEINTLGCVMRFCAVDRCRRDELHLSAICTTKEATQKDWFWIFVFSAFCHKAQLGFAMNVRSRVDGSIHVTFLLRRNRDFQVYRLGSRRK